MAELLALNKNDLKTGLAMAASSLAIAGAIEHQTVSPAVAQTSEPPAPPRVTNVRQITLVEHLPRPIRLPWILKRIGGCETKHDPHAKINYRAQNPDSTASGGFQFLDGTWNHFRGYKHAKNAPPRIQKIKAKRTLRKHGTSPWLASRSCWG